VRYSSFHLRGVRAADQSGFSLIELLVVILVIGILAAIAIPSFLNQKSKAEDSQAKVVARNAETAIETYATNNDGSYSGADVSALHSIDPALLTASSNDAYLAGVTSASASGYTVIASDPVSSDQFSVVKAGGTISRLCTASAGGCSGGTW
jgi:type IV pilus assembly protein PilA